MSKLIQEITNESRKNKNFIIPIKHIQFRVSLSSGPVVQNTNKTKSRVEIIFNIANSNKVLNQFEKVILRDKLEKKISNDYISIKVQEKRTQCENRQLAIHRVITLPKDHLMSDSEN